MKHGVSVNGQILEDKSVEYNTFKVEIIAGRGRGRKVRSGMIDIPADSVEKAKTYLEGFAKICDPDDRMKIRVVSINSVNFN